MQMSSRIIQHAPVYSTSIRLSGRIRDFTASAVQHDTISHLPRIARPSLWQSLIPRFLRRRAQEEEATATTPQRRLHPHAKRDGTSIVTLGLIVGSFAINVIALRREIANYTRDTEVKLGLLREVVRRVKAGEEVDVKRLLGTGDPEKEKEWEEMMKDLENYNDSHRQKPEQPQSSVVDKVKTLASTWFERLSTPTEEAREVTSTADEDEAVEHSTQPQAKRPAFMM